MPNGKKTLNSLPISPSPLTSTLPISPSPLTSTLYPYPPHHLPLLFTHIPLTTYLYSLPISPSPLTSTLYPYPPHHLPLLFTHIPITTYLYSLPISPSPLTSTFYPYPLTTYLYSLPISPSPLTSTLYPYPPHHLPLLFTHTPLTTYLYSLPISLSPPPLHPSVPFNLPCPKHVYQAHSAPTCEGSWAVRDLPRTKLSAQCVGGGKKWLTSPTTLPTSSSLKYRHALGPASNVYATCCTGDKNILSNQQHAHDSAK